MCWNLSPDQWLCDARTAMMASRSHHRAEASVRNDGQMWCVAPSFSFGCVRPRSQRVTHVTCSSQQKFPFKWFILMRTAWLICGVDIKATEQQRPPELTVCGSRPRKRPNIRHTIIRWVRCVRVPTYFYKRKSRIGTYAGGRRGRRRLTTARSSSYKSQNFRANLVREIYK